MNYRNEEDHAPINPDVNPSWDYNKNIRFDLKVSKEIHDTRMEICKNCDKLNTINFCKQCGCFMPLKTWLKSSNCPLGKW